MLLADEAAAATRLADYAAMSAYAYAEDQDCGNVPKLEPVEIQRLLQRLSSAGWERVKAAEFVPPCEDDVGLFYHAWKRETAGNTEVLLSFRGTWGFKDWWYGNSYWFRRFFTDNHQYARARAYAEKAVRYFEEHRVAGKALKFSTTGHSLGGGLAQAVLYDRPNTFTQAYAFAPTSATAYTTRRDKSPFAICNCNGTDPEPRIYRIYESYEILANLRIFHKLIFAPEPWVNEVRFNYASGSNPIAQHSMARFALTLMGKLSSAPSAKRTQPWYSAPDMQCTIKFQESQRAACGAAVCK